MVGNTKNLRGALAFGALFFVSIQMTMGMELVEVKVDTEITSRKMIKEKDRGRGFTEKMSMDFVVSIKNPKIDELKDITVVTFPFGKSLDWKRDRDGKIDKHEIIEEAYETIASGEEKKIKFSAKFESWEYKAKKLTRGGFRYGGVGVKVFQKDKLILEKVVGTANRTLTKNLMANIDKGNKKKKKKKKKS